MSSDAPQTSFSANMQKAEDELSLALARYAQSLAQEVDNCLEDAVRRRRDWNAFRLHLVLPSFIETVKREIINGSQQQRLIVVEMEGHGLTYWHKDPKTGANLGTRYDFQEPDEHYLGLLREAFGPKFRVWCAYAKGLMGRYWKIYAKYADWPKEHHSPLQEHAQPGKQRRRR
jgi:hypothetical protein